MKTVVPSELSHHWREYYRQSLLLRELFSGLEDEAGECNNTKTQNVMGEDEEDWETFANGLGNTGEARTEKHKLGKQLSNTENDIDKAFSDSLATTSNILKSTSREKDSSVAAEKEERKQALSERILHTFADKQKSKAWKDIENKRNATDCQTQR